ncbi:MAG: 3-isopropylmalate dehydratase small subunit [Xanthomonadales bacterium]|nr:3-isopropylmalate dehydratase small subunit [Gammaproteobacteria bacterium]MBT8053466.1 3-isopropylmalate dehydratase small subunit [Gammaproteobacteria bacterium]NND55834.1 3-isopropylmalate dehydratase small subunit [Xanthomonadales bacterium]NNK50946.1 3-isopropylmalate dehydratase small subunit [Xanthomonadales bacterium]
MSQTGVLDSRTFNLPVDNIDTDQIIPGQFLTTTERDGLGQFCFYSWRFDENGSERASHALKAFNPGRQSVLVAGSNFGCGSSREHAPWALLDFGFKAVISSRFADIFRSNALKNGLLPVKVSEEVAAFLHAHPDHSVQIDIGNNLLTVEGHGKVEFPLDPFSAYCLTRGIDQLEFLLKNESDISRFENRRGA